MIPTTPLGTRLTSTRVRPGTTPSLRCGVEVLVRRARVVAGGQRDVQRLVERVLPRLARLPHDQVDDLVLAVEHQVVQPEQALRPLVDADPAPRELGLASPAERLGDVDRGRLRDVRQRRAAQRRLDRHGLAARGDDPAGQALDVVGFERVRRPRVVLGIGRPLDEWSAGGSLSAHASSVGRRDAHYYR